VLFSNGDRCFQQPFRFPILTLFPQIAPLIQSGMIASGQISPQGFPIQQEKGRKGNKGMLVAIIALVVLLIVGASAGTGYFLFGNK
jgi:hypothetical protein